MIAFWIAATGLTLTVLTALLVPLVRGARHVSALKRADFDITVYKDQLLEIDRDVDRGILKGDQAGAARTEIERRMLAAAGGDEGRPIPKGGRAPGWLLAAILVVVPTSAFGLYVFLGQPTMPDQPFAERKVPKPADMALRRNQVDQMIRDMEARAKQDPTNPNTWAALGQMYQKLGKFAQSVQAYQHLVVTTGRQAEALMALGEAMFVEAGEIVTPAAVKLFKEAKTKRPDHPMTYYYLALQRGKSGDSQGAMDEYAGLLAISQANAKWVPEIKSRMKTLAANSDVKVPVVKLLPPAPVAPGPTREQMRQAQGMAPSAQQAMILSMVKRLAGKLKENPDDLQGWKRLAKAYEVLGDTTKLANAKAQIKRLGGGGMTAAPGPTREQMRQAQGMAPAARQGMILSMVKRLAGKLKANPDDLQGWKRLAKAYQVLGDTTKLANAQVQIKRLEGR